MTRSASLFAILGLCTVTAQAVLAEPPGDTVVTPASQQGEAVDKPSRGQSREAVAAQYGPPSRRYPAVGDPPIYRWEYPHFTVYFEGDHVIHAVTAATGAGSDNP